MRKPTVTATAVTPPPAERTITLTMGEDVARTLFVLTGNITGCWESSRRGHTTAIYHALQRMGVGGIDRHLYCGIIDFEDEPVDA